MSLKKNILANYVSQIYVTLISIFMMPFYLKYMGLEAYGLVGFYAMLQVWFQLLDVGLTPTLARETARFNGGQSDAQTLRRLLRAMEGIFVGVAVIGALLMMAGADAIARHWLTVQQLPLAEVGHALMLMAAVVALRWVCGLYRGAVTGFERLVWLSGFNMAVATARFVLVIPYFMYVGVSPVAFFSYQLILAVVELGVLVRQVYRLLPGSTQTRTPWNWEPLRVTLKFSMGIAVTGSVWVLVTQTDKLLLSKLLPLADYAYFTLAVLVASGVNVVSGPISAALLPRMSKLVAQANDAAVLALYRQATQFVCAIATPVALVLAMYSEQVLWAWTGDPLLARTAAPALTLYALGNGILVLNAFPYYLQYAKGDLRLHLIGSFVFLLLLVPALIGGATRYGVEGAGWAWLGANAVYFLLWVPRVHARFLLGLHYQWLLRDVGGIVAATSLAAGAIGAAITWPHGRLELTLSIVLVGAVLLAVAASCSPWMRTAIKQKFQPTI